MPLHTSRGFPHKALNHREQCLSSVALWLMSSLHIFKRKWSPCCPDLAWCFYDFFHSVCFLLRINTMMLLNNRNIVINKKRIVFLEHLQIEHTLSLHIIPFKSKCNLHRKLLWILVMKVDLILNAEKFWVDLSKYYWEWFLTQWSCLHSGHRHLKALPHNFFIWCFLYFKFPLPLVILQDSVTHFWSSPRSSWEESSIFHLYSHN